MCVCVEFWMKQKKQQRDNGEIEKKNVTRPKYEMKWKKLFHY